MAAVKEVQETAAVKLGALLDAGEGVFVTLVAGETRLAAHRTVLAARSPVFQAMFQHDTLEANSGHVVVTDVEGPVMRELLDYMYTLQAPQLPHMALIKLLTAADKYGVSGLKAVCEEQVTAQLAVENAAATAVLAVRHSCPNLTAATVAFIRAHNFQVMATQGWADAMRSQPEDLVEVSRLLADPPAETSTSATQAARRQPAGGHGLTATSAEQPTDACDTPPLFDVAVSYYRSLSEEERARRLREAATDGAVEKLRALLAAGADVGAGDDEMLTSLHCAAREGHVQAVKCLLDGGAQVDTRSNLQNTPLHLAAWKGRVAVVRLLLASSADLNARNTFGKTPLHRAALHGRAEAAAALLYAGADRSVRDSDGKSPLELARQNNHQELIELLT
ncbi:poly [ADP-ribose] polymerase tankyrase-1-like [Schistocerca gregaria]|uniref:poly [ADP-ribose] polymerase tankyrase-1-like n=1 Tax=Schistocerca gregaria TaxID=7010 RepID=UPI00211E834D|nr:poly [ADP-ribose] polymerase tankyrase-1-like [Schistocerca gregaria]